MKMSVFICLLTESITEVKMNEMIVIGSYACIIPVMLIPFKIFVRHRPHACLVSHLCKQSQLLPLVNNRILLSKDVGMSPM